MPVYAPSTGVRYGDGLMLQPTTPTPPPLEPWRPKPTPLAAAVKALFPAVASVMLVVVVEGLSAPSTTSFGSAATAARGKAADAARAAAPPAAAASSALRERGIEAS